MAVLLQLVHMKEKYVFSGLVLNTAIIAYSKHLRREVELFKKIS